MENSELTLGKLIREDRVNAGFTLEELCLRISISKGYMSKIESNLAIPSSQKLEWLGLSLRWDEERYALALRLRAQRVNGPDNEVSQVLERIKSIVEGHALEKYFIEAAHTISPSPAVLRIVEDYLVKVVALSDSD